MIWLRENWHYFALVLFAVAAGQIGRLGHSLERGHTIGRKQIIVELSMLPAFGSLGGALAAEWSLPIWSILLFGICAGWLGFATFRLMLAGARMIAGRIAEAPKDTTTKGIGE